MSRRLFRRFVELLYHLRTEAGTPTGHALSVAVGVLIGCYPVYGLHLAISVIVGRILRLNRIEIYLATNVNNPITAPLLIFAEVQIGSLVLHGHFRELSMEAVRELSLLTFLWELAVGATVLGAVLGCVLGVVTYRVCRASFGDEFRNRLVEECALEFLPAGFLHWESVRAILRADSAYLEILRRGLLPKSGTLIDAGCGKGVFMTLVATYHRMDTEKLRPIAWSPPPRGLTLVGYDRRPRRTRVARLVLGNRARVEEQDVTRTVLPQCDGIVLIDILRQFTAGERRTFLNGAADALVAGGRLIIRDRGDPEQLSTEIRQCGLIPGKPEVVRVFVLRRFLLVAEKARF